MHKLLSCKLLKLLLYTLPLYTLPFLLWVLHIVSS